MICSDIWHKYYELCFEIVIGFAPSSSSAFYVLELCSKSILKTPTANFMKNFHVGNVCFPYKALE